jgi:hypothetical protein
VTFTRGRTRRRTNAARRRRAATAAVALCTMLWWSATASAQLDPILFLKRVPPTVIIVFDTSLRMLEDGSGNFYDPHFYEVLDDAAVVTGAFPNIDTLSTKTYRRVYKNLQYTASLGKYTADTVTATAAVWDPANSLTSNSEADIAFLDPTRYKIAKDGIATAVGENAGGAYRWGLIRLRQKSPAWRVEPNCESASVTTPAGFGDTSPCNAGGPGSYAIYAPSVAEASYAQLSAPAGTVVVTPAAGTASSIVTMMNRHPEALDPSALIPAGIGGVGFDDRPLTYALLDAKSAASAAMAADTAANRSCRNTVVVLVTSGRDDGDSGYTAANDPATTAATFLSVSGGGETKRVPVHVVAIKPAAADVTELQSIATASGGLYWSATSSDDVARAINYAVQQGFARAGDFDLGTTSEYVPVSPIVGTVNLLGGKNVDGGALAFTEIYKGGNITPASVDDPMLPQRSNMIVTAGFAIPGFDGAIRAFRTYEPVKDPTQTTGWKFTAAGTRLWPDLDGRPELAGKARVPSDPNSRNIYTYIPDATGGGSVVAFTSANASTLLPHMQTGASTESVISLVRSQPLGAVIGSTPALQDVPSLDPPPDDAYGRAEDPTSFAGTYKDRRATMFVGANDGMIHAIDARTGYEVWAFIPYNLLPKLRTLADGQPVEQFDYFVDSSPKLAEVKLNGQWRSLLIIGQGNGGVFYQAFDITSAGMGVTPTLDDISAVNAMLARYDSPNESIEFKWAFPNYSHFDPTIFETFAVTDGTPGGVVKLYGDVSKDAGATDVEKTVGFSWSDPAVGALNASRSVTAVIVGSGYFPEIETSALLKRGGSQAPAAGNAMYLLDANTGTPIGGAASCPQISSGSGSGTGCVSIGDEAGDGRKNALQADPTAAGESGSHVVTKAYIGDIDGRYWRFNFDEFGSISARQMVDADVPIYASSALLFVGTSDVYMFFATGSDLLPSNAPGGTGTFRLYGLKDLGDTTALTKFGIDLAAVTNTNGLATGERPSTAPSVAGDIVFYTTTNESAAAPCDDFTGNLYAVTYAGGAAYDSDASGTVENNEDQVVRQLEGRATAPFIVDQHLYIGTMTKDGAMVEAFGDPDDFNNGIGQVGVRILSWREIR